MRTFVHTLILVVGLTLIGAGCGTDGTGSGSESAAQDVDGREFWSTSVIEDGQPRSMVEGTRITLRFNGDGIGASAGCNSMGGTFELDGATLVVSELAMTEMGCDPDRHAQDDFVIRVLSESPTLTLDGTVLTLVNGDTRLELLDTSVANPDRSIIDTVWTVTGFIDGQTASSFAIDEAAYVLFNADSTMTGFDGCDQFSAPVEVSDGSTGGPVEGDGEMQFGAINRTPSADCANPAYVDAFHRVFATGDATFTINGTNLTILNSSGVGITALASQ